MGLIIPLSPLSRCEECLQPAGGSTAQPGILDNISNNTVLSGAVLINLESDYFAIGVTRCTGSDAA